MAQAALTALRAVTKGVPRVTRGIPSSALSRFDNDSELNHAISAANKRLDTLLGKYGESYMLRDELTMCDEMQVRWPWTAHASQKIVRAWRWSQLMPRPHEQRCGSPTTRARART